MDSLGLSTRDGLLLTGVVAAGAARYFYQRKWLRPFQAAVIVAYPSFGVAIMHTVIDWSTPRTIQALEQSAGSTEQLEAARQQARLATTNLAARLKHLSTEPEGKQH